MRVKIACRMLVAIAIAANAAVGAAAPAKPDFWPRTDENLWPLGALERQDLMKPRSKAPFDLTGTWTMRMNPADGGAVGFLPLPKLTPAAQALYDEGVRANAEGKAFRDDTGACWPYGMPKWWNRVWPIQFIQYPTMIVAIQGLENSVRWIYLDGRGHANPDLIEQTYNGDSVGRWVGDTLVVDTTTLQPKRHWVMQGIPTSDKFHIVEKIRMGKDHKTFKVELIMTDPENWEGEWRVTKTMEQVKGEDPVESHCLPDLNDHVVGAQKDHNEK